MSPQGAPLALGTARSTTDVHISPRDAEETGSRSATPGRGETSFAPVSREPGHVQAALNRCRNHEDAVAPAAARRCSRTAPSGYRRSEQQWPAGGRIGDKRVLFRSAKGLGHSLIWMCFVGQLACDCRGVELRVVVEMLVGALGSEDQDELDSLLDGPEPVRVPGGELDRFSGGDDQIGLSQQ